MVLPNGKNNGIIGTGKSQGAFATTSHTHDTDLIRSRGLMAVSSLLLLAGVVVLSTATRQPCLHVSTGPWRLWKVGHMTKSEGQEACKLRVAAAARTFPTAPKEPPATPPSIYFPQEETIPPAIPLIAQIRHFRSPPALL